MIFNVMTFGISMLWIISIYAIIKALKKNQKLMQVHVNQALISMDNIEKVEMEGDTGRQLWEKTNSFLNGKFGR